MNSPFNVPDEYVRGLFKAGQSLLQALTPTPGSVGEIAVASAAAPLAELQLNYLQQQLALWSRMMTGAGGGDPVVAPKRGDRRFNAAVPAQRLMGEALSVAATICGLSLPSVMMAKEAVNRAFEASLGEGVRFERRLFHSLFGTADQQEARAAFLAKRQPAFRHR